MEKYRIDSVLYGKGPDKNEVEVRLQVIDTRAFLHKRINEIYKKEWIDGFSKEDVAYLSTIYCAQNSNQLELIEKFPRKTSKITVNVVLLAVLFTVCVGSGNLIGKISEISLSSIPLIGRMITSPILFDTGIFYCSIAYAICDILTEVYGFKVGRLTIWIGLIGISLITAYTNFLIRLPTAQVSIHDQECIIGVFGTGFRMYIACFVAAFFGDWFNAAMLSRMKVLTQGRYLWLRVVSSTSLSALWGVTVGHIIAWTGTYDFNLILKLIFNTMIYRVIASIALLPVVYLVVSYLKKKDRTDVYDHSCSLNPFSLDVD